MTKALTKKTNRPDLVQASWDLLSENSKAGYKTDLNMFHEFVNKELPDVTAQDIVDYVGFLNGKGYKNSTINRKIASVSKLFKVYHTSGLIKFNPVELARQSGKLTFKSIRTRKSNLTIEQVRDCINCKDVSRSDRDAGIMIRFLAKTGLRISEMLNIELKDIEEIDGKIVRIRILGKGKKERSITLEKDFVNEVRELFGHKTLLFCTGKGEKYNRRYVWRLVRERFKRSGGLKVSPHGLRHFFITYKIATEKKDIKAVSMYAGHANVSTTLSMYVDTELDHDEAKIDI